MENKKLKRIELFKLDKILDNMYILEKYDEYNMHSCPENALSSTIDDITELLEKEGISLETTIIAKNDEFINGITVGEYLAENYDDTSTLNMEWDGEYLS